MTIEHEHIVLEAEPKTIAKPRSKGRKRMSQADIAKELWQMDDERLNSVSSFLIGHDDEGEQFDPAVRRELEALRADPSRARMIAALLRELGGRESRQDLHRNDAIMLKRRLSRVLGRVA